MNRGQYTSVALFAAAALLAALAAPMILGQVYIADDLGEFHLPLRNFYAQQLAADEPFDWCPDLYCGFYLTGEGQVGGYHPLHLLLYHTMPLSLAFDLECWLSYPAMLVGMAMFLRRWRLRLPAAIFGAIAFTFGSFNFLHFMHPNAVAVVAHLPWLLWGMDVMLRSSNTRHRWLAFAAVAALTGSQWLLGYPQYVMFSFMVQAAYVVFIQCTPHAPREDCIARSVKSTLVWLAAVALGTLIGGVQLLPTIDALQQSVRQSPGAEVTDPGSLHPLNFVQFFGPYLFENRVVGQNTHELGLYLGAIPLVVAIFAVMNGLRIRRYRSLVIAAAVAAIVSLLWAFGTLGPFGWLQANVPLLNKFRLPCRAIVVSQLATATLAAIGFSILCRGRTKPLEPSEGYTGTGWLWSLVIASVLAAVAAPRWWPDYASDFPYRLFGPVTIAVAVGLVSLAARGKSWALAAMIILTAIDLGVYGMSYSIIGKSASLGEFVRETNAPHAAPDGRVALDLLAGTQTAPGNGGVRVGNRILLKGWKRVDGYAGLEPARRLDYQNSKALRLAGVGWVRDGDSNHSAWTPLPDHQPRAWLVTQAIVSKNPAEDLSAVTIREAALVDSAIDLPEGASGTVVVEIDRPGRFSCKTDGSSRQLLVIGESFHAGWIATIDGEKAEILRVNGDFLGVLVPSGGHEIQLQFAPASLKFGRMASGCGLGLLVVVLLLATRQHSHNSSPPHALLPSAAER